MNTNTNPIFAALAAAFVAELDAAYLDYFGDEYADEYFSDAVDEATRLAGNLEADFLPFLGDAADAYGPHFNEWVGAKVPAHIAELAGLWVELGFPEPESDCGGDITDRMRCAVYEVIAEQVRDAADKLAELAADFTERFNEAEELVAEADELEAEELEAAEELAALGVRANYAGLYLIGVTEHGAVLSRVFDSATAALAEYRKSHA